MRTSRITKSYTEYWRDRNEATKLVSSQIVENNELVETRQIIQEVRARYQIDLYQTESVEDIPYTQERTVNANIEFETIDVLKNPMKRKSSWPRRNNI